MTISAPKSKKDTKAKTAKLKEKKHTLKKSKLGKAIKPDALALGDAATQAKVAAAVLSMCMDGVVTDEEATAAVLFVTGVLLDFEGEVDEKTLKHVEAEVGRACERIQKEGVEKVLAHTVKSLKTDEDKGVALFAAATIAFADGDMADEEAQFLAVFREQLGVPEWVAYQLVGDALALAINMAG